MKTILTVVLIFLQYSICGQQRVNSNKIAKLEKQSRVFEKVSYGMLGASAFTIMASLITLGSGYSELEADPYSELGGRKLDRAETLGYISISMCVAGLATYLIHRGKRYKAARLQLSYEMADMINHQKLQY